MVRYTHITARCTLENSIYGYFPNLGAKIFLTIAFALLAVEQAVQFI